MKLNFLFTHKLIKQNVPLNISITVLPVRSHYFKYSLYPTTTGLPSPLCVVCCATVMAVSHYFKYSLYPTTTGLPSPLCVVCCATVMAVSVNNTSFTKVEI